MKQYYITVSDSTNQFNICEGRAEASSDGVAVKRFTEWAKLRKLLPNLKKGEGMILSIVRSA